MQLHIQACSVLAVDTEAYLAPAAPSGSTPQHILSLVQIGAPASGTLAAVWYCLVLSGTELEAHACNKKGHAPGHQLLPWAVGCLVLPSTLGIWM
jgi:hypothetical protein